jgi:hypothetical protein
MAALRRRTWRPGRGLAAVLAVALAAFAPFHAAARDAGPDTAREAARDTDRDSGRGAPPLVLATFNLTWLMDRATHARWVDACARHGWPRDTSALPEAARDTLRALPYCDVHNGMAWPPETCTSTADGWPARARYPAAHPCRESLDLADWPAYEDKLAQLREAFATLAAKGVNAVALQEVFDEAAVRPLLPPGWSVRTTRGLPGSPDVPQQVGLAWAPGVSPRGFEAYAALSDSGLPGRTLRPGLAFTVDVAGRPVQMLVVHLKAGCRSRVIDDPLRPNDRPDRLDAIATDCAMARMQLPALEAWIDARAGRDIVVIGDFNRSILLEPPKDRPDRPTRLDGTAVGSPTGPCRLVAEGARFRADCPVRTGAMFPEFNDDLPAGAVLWRASFADRKGGRTRPGGPGDCRIRSGRAAPGAREAELTHDGIDHVLLGGSLKRRLSPAALELRMLGWLGEDGRPLVASPARALPSDHCAHWVVLR